MITIPFSLFTSRTAPPNLSKKEEYKLYKVRRNEISAKRKAATGVSYG